MKPNEMQVAGNHYASEYQHWDFVADALGGLYLEGQITKYICRWRKKNGIQDLEKALHFTHKLVETATHGLQSLGAFNDVEGVDVRGLWGRFVAANELAYPESQFILSVATWKTKEDVEHLAAALERYIKFAAPGADASKYRPV